jgi:anti-anti-sigma factor
MSTHSGAPHTWLSVAVQRDSSGPVRVVAEGEIDMTTAGQMRESLTAALDRHPSALVVDLAAVTFIDSSGLAALVHGFKQAAKDGASLIVVDPQPMVRRILEITGLLRVLTGND